MPSWLKIALGILAGVFAGGLSLGLIEMAGHQIATGDAKFAIAAVGLGVAGFFGGLVALFIGRAKWLAWAIATLLMALSLINVFSFPHPIWFVPLAGFSLLIGALAANRFMRSRIGA